jgi:hypothetical protein
MRTKTLARTGAPEKGPCGRSILSPPSPKKKPRLRSTYSRLTPVSIGWRFFASAVPAIRLIFLATAVAGAAPKTTPKPAAKPPLDFSGVWELDLEMSLNVSDRMKGAVLSVEQKGNRIRISPAEPASGPHPGILTEEIVVDGIPYEKALGPAGKRRVTAGWSPDGRSLWITVEAGSPEDPDSAVERSVWKLTEDRTVWVRESVSVSEGHTGRARLVFRKRKS